MPGKMKFKCHSQSRVEFSDIKTMIESGKLVIDFFVEPTNLRQYLECQNQIIFKGRIIIFPSFFFYFLGWGCKCFLLNLLLFFMRASGRISSMLFWHCDHVVDNININVDVVLIFNIELCKERNFSIIFTKSYFLIYLH